jgi:ATP-dependent RNA helicase DeaD
LERGEVSAERALVERMIEAGHDAVEVAAAAMRLARAHEAQRPLAEIRPPSQKRRSSSKRRGGAGGRRETAMVRLVINAGKAHGIRAGDVVGAIANEAGIPGRAIGAIDIHAHRTFVGVSQEHVRRVLGKLKRLNLRGRPVVLRLADRAEREVRRTA